MMSMSTKVHSHEIEIPEKKERKNKKHIKKGSLQVTLLLVYQFAHCFVTFSLYIVSEFSPKSCGFGIQVNRHIDRDAHTMT